MYAKKQLNWLVERPIAHRGLHSVATGVIENSTTAALAAVQHNFSIECDVQITRDGEAVVFHDFALERLTNGHGLVCDHKASALAQIEMKKTSDRIPTLEEFLQLVAGRVPVIVEIKSEHKGDMRLTHRVIALVKNTSKAVALKSFDPQIVSELRRLAPEIPRGIIAMNSYEYPEFVHLAASEKHAMANLLHYPEMQPDFISWNVKDLPSAAPFLCRNALGLPLMTWTVRSEADRKMAATYADQAVFEGFIP